MENAIEYIKGDEKEVYAEQLQKHRSKLEALLYNAADDENEIENQAENQDDGKEAKEENTPTKPITTGSGSSSSNHKNKKKKKKKSISSASGIANASKYITFDILRPHFEKPLVEVAELFGICPTLMKRICRKNQIPQWPYRQILALKKGIKSIKNALEHVEGTQATNLLEQLTTQEQKLQLILQNPATLVSSTASSSVKIQNPKSLGIIQEKEKKQQHFESPHHLPRQSKISPQLSPSTSPSKSSDTNTDAPTTNGGFRLPSMSSLLNH
jgi:hypothetical protein